MYTLKAAKNGSQISCFHFPTNLTRQFQLRMSGGKGEKADTENSTKKAISRMHICCRIKKN